MAAFQDWITGALWLFVWLPEATNRAGGSVWPTAVQILDFFNKLVTTLAFLVAGGWAWFRFARLRTLKKRVEFSFDWKASPMEGSSIVGILTVKFKNTGNTEVILRKDAHPRVTLGFGLIRPATQPNEIPSVNLSSRELSALPFLFKPHSQIEPGETIDDVVVLCLDVTKAVAIQFHVQVFTVTKRGKRKHLMSSMIAFPMALDPIQSFACSEDEQDDYDEFAETRGMLSGWIAESKKLLSQNRSGDNAEKLRELIEDGSSSILALDRERSPEALKSAQKYAEELMRMARPLL
jgi:hypothetical protein